MPKDGWMTAAMADDTMVVELLLRLKNQCHATPPARSAVALLPLNWGLRQPRSKPVFRCGAVLARKEEERDPTRGSPTTPLSWSGGGSGSGAGSPSATADGAGMEESSRAEIRSSTARSKAAVTIEATNAPPSKRSRKRKTFTDLKEEESLLLKERKRLRKGLAALRVTVKEHRAANERLKRMKRDMDLQPRNQAIATSFKNSPPCDSCKVQELVESQESFILPDLNMMPSEGDFGSGALFAMS